MANTDADDKSQHPTLNALTARADGKTNVHFPGHFHMTRHAIIFLRLVTKHFNAVLKGQNCLSNKTHPLLRLQDSTWWHSSPVQIDWVTL